MKLRTEIDDFPAEVWIDDLRHDAMAAHALLQAMDESRRHYWNEHSPLPWIKQRAAEILKGWLGEEVCAGD